MVENLTRHKGWKWSVSTPDSEECHVRHNPAYTSCVRTGNFWFDSPLFNETGCYTSTEFGKKFGAYNTFDLQYYGEWGLCIRYKIAPYQLKAPPLPKNVVMN